MKACTKCGIPKETEEFAKKKGRASSWCKECHNIYTRHHYKSNKEYYSTRNKTHREEMKKWMADIKSDLQCIKCREATLMCLDFHHRDPGLKDCSIYQAIRRWGKKRIIEEISKCDVLCANCHRKEHAKMALVGGVQLPWGRYAAEAVVAQPPVSKNRLEGSSPSRRVRAISSIG